MSDGGGGRAANGGGSGLAVGAGRIHDIRRVWLEKEGYRPTHPKSGFVDVIPCFRYSNILIFPSYLFYDSHKRLTRQQFPVPPCVPLVLLKFNLMLA